MNSIAMAVIRSSKKFFLKIKSISFVCVLMITTSLITSCQKTVWVPALNRPDLRISQHQETTTQPAKYYVCGNTQYPCRPVTNKRQKVTVHHIAKQRTGSRKSSTLLINKPKEQHHEAPVTVKSCKINQDKL